MLKNDGFWKFKQRNSSTTALGSALNREKNKSEKPLKVLEPYRFMPFL